MKSLDSQGHPTPVEHALVTSVLFGVTLALTACPGDTNGPTGVRLLMPFQIAFVEMDKAFLVDLFGHPVYETIELQTFPDGDGALRPRAMFYRSDGVVDVYSPSTDEESIETQDALRALVGDVTFSQTTIDLTFDISDDGLTIDFRMVDREGREIVVEVSETAGGVGDMGFLAPVGSLSAEPAFFPLYYFDSVSFVPRDGATMEVRIDGEPATVVPMSVEGHDVHLARYSTASLVCLLNPNRQADLNAATVEVGAPSARDENLSYELSWDDDRPHIAGLTTEFGDGLVTVEFSPPLPDLLDPSASPQLEGTFTIEVNGDPDIVTGTYGVSHGPEEVALELQPELAWQPPMMTGDPWVSTYLFRTVFEVDDPNTVQMQAEWTRTGPPRGWR